MEDILGNINQFLEAAPAWVLAITGIVTACSALTALTPTKTDDKIVNSILYVLNILSLNVFKNKNADAE